MQVRGTQKRFTNCPSLQGAQPGGGGWRRECLDRRVDQQVRVAMTRGARSSLGRAEVTSSVERGSRLSKI